MEKKRSISKKKTDKLYGLLHEEIVTARVKIQRLGNDKILKEVDNILSDLTLDLPTKAIDIFLIHRPKGQK